MNVKKNRNCSLRLVLRRFIHRVANLWCFVGILVASIVQDTGRKECFQCQVGSKATSEWRNLFLCRYAMRKCVPMQAN